MGIVELLRLITDPGDSVVVNAQESVLERLDVDA